MKSKYYMVIAMIVLAIFAIGSVSASENITVDIDEPTDDIAVDDVTVEEIDEQTDSIAEDDVTVEEANEGGNRLITYTQLTVNTNSNFTDINNKISTGVYSGYEFVFTPGTYNNFAMVTGNNNKFTGNGATLIGSTDNLFTVAGSNNIVITGFNMQTATGKAAIYGANVFNAEITNNNISGGKDGINIMQTYDNVTITGNRITGVTRDAISLVDHRTLTDAQWAARGCSNISNNIITGSSEYGMFFGGNFKGKVCGNVINGTATGIEFAGKKAATNGRLCVELNYNTIVGVTTGISMNHPDVICFKMLNNTVCTTSSTNFAILAGSYFDVDNNAIISLINNTFCGYTSSDFYYEITEDINNTGLVPYP